MNFTTRVYNDGLEGNFFACKPGNVAEGLEFVCTVGLPIFGSAFLLIGGWLLYLAFIQRRHRKLRAKQIRDATYVPNAQDAQRVYPQSYSTDMFSYIEKLIISASAISVGGSLIYFVNGFGTMYPTTHIRGQVGDISGENGFFFFFRNSFLLLGSSG